MPKKSNNLAIDEPIDTSATCLPTKLDALVGYALRRAQLKVFQHLVSNLNKFDLRPAQFTALAIIEQYPGLMQADLANILAIEPPQAVVLLNKLEARSLAVRVRCKPDRRSYGIFLSKAGETLLKELKEVARQSDEESTAALTAAERDQLVTLLHKVYLSED